MRIYTNWTFLRKHTHPNVAIPHLLVYSRTILVDFSAQKVNFKIFRFCPIVKSMISLYKLNTRGAGPISFHKFWNFGKTFSWHRHIICHHGLPTNSQFGVLVQPKALAQFARRPSWTWIMAWSCSRLSERRVRSWACPYVWPSWTGLESCRLPYLQVPQARQPGAAREAAGLHARLCGPGHAEGPRLRPLPRAHQ